MLVSFEAFMEWNGGIAFRSRKDIDPKSLMDMAIIPNIEPVTVASGSSEKGNAAQVEKPRKKTMTSVYLKYFETAPDGKSRKCKFCGQTYSIATATGYTHLQPFVYVWIRRKKKKKKRKETDHKDRM